MLGDTYVSRMAASQLNALGMPELITHTPDAYFDLALDLALDPKKRTMVRQKLAAQSEKSPLFDTQRFTRDLEQLYQRMWHARTTEKPITWPDLVPSADANT